MLYPITQTPTLHDSLLNSLLLYGFDFSNFSIKLACTQLHLLRIKTLCFDKIPSCIGIQFGIKIFKR